MKSYPNIILKLTFIFLNLSLMLMAHYSFGAAPQPVNSLLQPEYSPLPCEHDAPPFEYDASLLEHDAPLFEYNPTISEFPDHLSELPDYLSGQESDSELDSSFLADFDPSTIPNDDEQDVPDAAEMSLAQEPEESTLPKAIKEKPGVNPNSELLRLCPVKDCKYKPKNSNLLDAHTYGHEKGSKFFCHICHNFGSNHRSGIIQHLAKHTGEKPYTCTFVGCDRAFTQKCTLDTHIKKHTGEKPHTCPYNGCNKAFVQKIDLNNHIKTHTGENLHKCTFVGCDKAFIKKSTLNIHIRTHTREKPYTCTFVGCNKAFPRLDCLNTHIKTHTGENLHKCTFVGCDKAFPRLDSLNTHIKTHTGEKPHKCIFDGCNKAFAQKGNLNTHIKKHTDEKPYKGSDSKLDLSFPADLDPSTVPNDDEQHAPGAVEMSLAQEPEESTLPKAIKEKPGVKRNLTTHTSEKPYTCPFDGCNKVFAQQSDLIYHIKTHTGENPHKCTFDGCDQAFIKKSTLNIHMITHTREKPYECTFDGCKFASKWEGSLKGHIETHKNKKPLSEQKNGKRKADDGADGDDYTNENPPKKPRKAHTPPCLTDEALLEPENITSLTTFKPTEQTSLSREQASLDIQAYFLAQNLETSSMTPEELEELKMHLWDLETSNP